MLLYVKRHIGIFLIRINSGRIAGSFLFEINNGVLNIVDEIKTPEKFEWVENEDGCYPVYK